MGSATSHDESADERVCVVATQQATFERCQAGFYPSPESYERTSAQFEYMAFYRTAPVSAVTQYAAVTDRVVQSRGESGPLTAADWAATIDPFSDCETVVVFELGELQTLDNPVTNDMSGVRGAWYCPLDALRSAETLSELSRECR